MKVSIRVRCVALLLCNWQSFLCRELRELDNQWNDKSCVPSGAFVCVCVNPAMCRAGKNCNKWMKFINKQGDCRGKSEVCGLWDVPTFQEVAPWSLPEELERMKKQNAKLGALQSQSQESNSVNPPVPSSKRIPDMFRATSTCEEIRRVVSTPVDLSGALGWLTLYIIVRSHQFATSFSQRSFVGNALLFQSSFVYTFISHRFWFVMQCEQRQN